MICYASSTNGRRNLNQLQRHGWRLLFNAAHPHLWRPGWRYALDNGAWSAFVAGGTIDLDKYCTAVERLGAGADWVILPDIVGGGRESLALSLSWLDWTLCRSRRVLIAVQDGQQPEDVARLLGPRVGVAIGGSTEWKEAQLGRRRWGSLCRDSGAWLHALRVNSHRRHHLAAIGGCHSTDGTNATRFSIKTPGLTRAAKQGALCLL